MANCRIKQPQLTFSRSLTGTVSEKKIKKSANLFLFAKITYICR